MNNNLNIVFERNGARLDITNYVRSVTIIAPKWGLVGGLQGEQTAHVMFGTNCLGSGDTNTARVLHNMLRDALLELRLRATLKYLDSEMLYEVAHSHLLSIAGHQKSNYMEYNVAFCLRPVHS